MLKLISNLSQKLSLNSTLPNLTSHCLLKKQPYISTISTIKENEEKLNGFVKFWIDTKKNFEFVWEKVSKFFTQAFYFFKTRILWCFFEKTPTENEIMRQEIDKLYKLLTAEQSPNETEFKEAISKPSEKTKAKILDALQKKYNDDSINILSKSQLELAICLKELLDELKKS